MNRFLWIRARAICGLLAVVLSPAIEGPAQVRPIYDQGAIGLGQMLKKIGNTKRIMHIGAHPDDEDSDMLAYLARKENARAVYLSLTRGDGGQNVIGPELFEALGVIRAEELLQARTLDGAEQMFTRAFDYGYSKTLAEAQRNWDEEIIKCDVVRAIRKFRPQVVVPRFGGTPRDGHGQHQFAGYIAPIAVKAAADADECKDAGPAWKVSKFYVGQGFRDTNAPTLSMNTGEYDHLIGRSYYEIAAQGRSQHKTQEQGGTELKGDRFSGVNLLDSDFVVRGAEESMFDGVDTSYRSLVRDQPAVADVLQKIEQDFKKGVYEVRLSNPAGATAVLLSTRASLKQLVDKERRLSETDRIDIRAKISEFDAAIRHSAGLQIDALTNSETAADEEVIGALVNVFFPDDSGIAVKSIHLDTPEGWDITEGETGAADDSPRARFFRETPSVTKSFGVEIPKFAKPTQPYFLESSRDGYLYRWENGPNQNRPFQPALMSAVVNIEIEGTEIEYRQPVEYRYADDTRGEIRRNFNVVPKVSVDLDQHLLVVTGSAQTTERHLSLNIRSNSEKAVQGTANLLLPKGWKVRPASKSFAISKKGGATSFDCTVIIPANTKPGEYKIIATATVGDRMFDATMNTISYDHIQTHRYYTPAETKVVIAELEVAPVTVGYVMGSGDSGPEALRQIGVEVELLDDKALTSGDLSRFDTIMIGIRASETNPAFIANNQRLLDYAKAGGTLIVQYQKFPFQSLNLAPYPVQFNARVAEEDARVNILEPGHPVFNYPNKITQKDFEGWVQERNLYAFRSFDEEYTPLLEAHDTGEDENKGGMVYTKLGEGQYMYVSYAFFRQLPAGVPGAYRLFANIVSLGNRDRK
ncbi:MAG: PIG-L family deacetylase [Acidobacteriota bacterium]|nr:PIG-L family deacetylase [Acidobacteriota bacterium]